MKIDGRNFQKEDAKNKEKKKEEDLNKRSRRIKCRKCGGFGHILAKCSSNLKKKRKSLKSTWSDELERSMKSRRRRRRRFNQ